MSVNFTDDDTFDRKITRHTVNKNDSTLSNSRSATIVSTVVSSILDRNKKDNINDPELDWLGIEVRMLSRSRFQFQDKTKSKSKPK